MVLRIRVLVMNACDQSVRVPRWQIGQVISPYLQLGAGNTKIAYLAR